MIRHLVMPNEVVSTRGLMSGSEGIANFGEED
jgi:hypothetical protein